MLSVSARRGKVTRGPELTHQRCPHIALRVENVDEALAALADQGVSAEVRTPKAAGRGIGRIGTIRDPDGVKMELLDRADLRDL